MGTRRTDKPLDVYREKRDFDKTPEPVPCLGGTGGNCFVVQKHHAKRLHYDLRLEIDGVLKSWAVTKGLSLDPAVRRLAVRTEDHPLSYADFEGFIADQHYGAGLVEIWDRGTWKSLEAIDPHLSLKNGLLKFYLFGERVLGGFALVRLAPEKKAENWLLVKEKDSSATSAFEPSDVWLGSIGPRPQNPSKLLPAFVKPQLATDVDRPPTGTCWVHEIKYDGYRLQALKNGKSIQLFTRGGKDWTNQLRSVANAVGRLSRDRLHLDGELVVFGEQGVTDFSALQEDLKNGAKHVTFVIFDCLQIDDRDLKPKPWKVRNGELRAVLADSCPPLKYGENLVGNGLDLFKAAISLGAEGIVSKHIERPWCSGRNRHWLKVKAEHRGVYVVGGYRKSSRRPFASLLLGSFESEGLVYKGRVGTGFSSKTFSKLADQFASLQIDEPPFSNPPDAARVNTVWLEPRVAIEVSYTEETSNGHLRHPKFIRVSNARPLPRAQHKPRIKLTSANRVLYPETGYTKEDLLDYLQALSLPLLRGLSNRFVSLVRAPEGNLAKAFFQRHAIKGMPAAIKSLRAKGEHKNYITIDTQEGLAAAAQFSVLELHIWGSKIETIEFPDRLVLDLDPDETLPFTAVRAAARLVRDVLSAAALTSYPLLTGGKGIHIVAPLDETANWRAVSSFAGMIARELSRAEPRHLVASMAKSKRRERIYIDWHRNRKGATAIVPWSPRARIGAPVAVPVSWEELSRAKSAADYDLARARRRYASLRGDPWDGYADIRQTVPK